MTSPPTAAAEPAGIPEAVDVGRVPTLVLVALVAFAAGIIWMVGFDNGQASAAVDGSGSFLHEFFHDSRHLAGAPCH